MELINSISAIDLLGVFGALLILWAFGLQQLRGVQADSFVYNALNFTGALLILISLFYAWNLASFLMEIAWLLISGYGIFKALNKPSKGGAS